MQHGIYYAYWEHEWDGDYHYYIDKVSRLGFDILEIAAGPLPEYSDEELKEFYSHIDEWWYNFCDDIHFHDVEDEIYRQELKDVINNPKYKWAFEYKK